MKIDPRDIEAIEINDDELIDLVVTNFSVEVIFSGCEDELHKWAWDNGYVKEVDA